jgi:hypothetical protein
MSEPQEPTPPLEEPLSPKSASGLPTVASTPDDRTMAMLCHLTGAFTGFLVPVAIRIIK